MNTPFRTSTFLGALGILAAGAVTAQEGAELPEVVSWTAYGTGSSGHAQAVAIGAALKQERGVNLRILPGKNDISRMVPLRDGRVQFSASGIASYFAQEGIEVFAEEDWGPQAVRQLLHSNPDHNQGLAATGESGIETVADVAGRRVAAVVGSAAINTGTEAILAFADLTWDDVDRIDFPGYGAAWEGMLNGQVDVAWGATTTSPAYQLANSPRGLTWLPVDHEDDEGWARLHAVAPYIFRHTATEGADISPENPHEGTNYPYPILITYAEQDADLVYAMTKTLIDLYPAYEGAAPGIDGLALDRQNLQWIIPYHDGAVRALEEAGVWSEETEAHNQRLIERQEKLQAAWDALIAQGLSGSELAEAWTTARAEIGDLAQ